MNGSFGETIVTTIKSHWENSPSLPILINSSFSFEQWLNAEAYVACYNVGHWVEGASLYETSQRHRISYGDLRVWARSWSKEGKDNSSELMVETKIAGDGTLSKHYAEIEADRRKLADFVQQSPNPKIEGLQLIFVYSFDPMKICEKKIGWPILISMASGEISMHELRLKRRNSKKSPFIRVLLLAWHVWKVPASTPIEVHDLGRPL